MTNEKLKNAIRAYAPHLYNFLEKESKEFDKTIEQYLEDSKENYVHIDNEHKIFDNETNVYDNCVFGSLWECEEDMSEDEYVITQYAYISLILHHEKISRQRFCKWGYEFSINEDDSVTIRGEFGKRITIQVECANKIVLI